MNSWGSLSIDTHSPFSDELCHNEGGHFDVGEDELAELLEPLRPHVPCPVCTSRGRTTAVLAVREGQSGRFARCTSFTAGPDHHCGHTERTCEKCGQGLMIRLGNGRAGVRTPSAGTRRRSAGARCRDRWWNGGMGRRDSDSGDASATGWMGAARRRSDGTNEASPGRGKD